MTTIRGSSEFSPGLTMKSENDPRVWGQVGFLIDSELSGETSAAQSSWVSGSLFTK